MKKTAARGGTAGRSPPSSTRQASCSTVEPVMPRGTASSPLSPKLAQAPLLRPIMTVKLSPNTSTSAGRGVVGGHAQTHMR